MHAPVDGALCIRVPPGQKGARLRGHSFRIELHCSGEPGAQTGWLMDFRIVRYGCASARQFLVATAAHSAACAGAAPVIAVSPATAKLRLFRTPPMPPRKTALAIAALQSHSAPLDMRQRRVLILADGRRSAEELIALGGSNAATIVQELVRQGYLDDGRPGGAPASATPTAPSPAPADPRRALLNARMYLLDLLQLQRHPASRPLQQQLREAREDAATLQAIAHALRAMPEMTSERYAQRIRERVLEVLPAPLHASLAAA